MNELKIIFWRHHIYTKYRLMIKLSMDFWDDLRLLDICLNDVLGNVKT